MLVNEEQVWPPKQVQLEEEENKDDKPYGKILGSTK
jgi:hypothetical protein